MKERARMRLLRTILLFLFVIPSMAWAASFGPWNADVRVGDGNSVRKAPLPKKETGVYSAAQGGSYFLIRFFQIVISPQDGPNCRYEPTCSAYGKNAVERYGALLGAMLAGDRIIRCNPYSPVGSDPLPVKIFGK
jgi:hypothetical protein